MGLLVGELREDEGEMRRSPPRRDDAAFAGDHFGARADDDVDPGLDVGVAGLADRADAAAADPDISLDDARVIEDDRVGDDRIDGALSPAPLALPHAVADHLAAAELHLL